MAIVSVDPRRGKSRKGSYGCREAWFFCRGSSLSSSRPRTSSRKVNHAHPLVRQGRHNRASARDVRVMASRSGLGGEMNKPFSCFLIGSDTLLAQCGEILLGRGHSIKGVVTSSPRIVEWAAQRSLPTLSAATDYASVLAAAEFD